MIELPLATPHNWERAPLWTIAARRELRGQPGADRLSVYRDHGVVPTSSRDDNFNKPGEDLAQYKVVRPGDLVLNKMKTWQGSLAVSEYSGIVSPAYYVLRLDESVHPRWIHHLLRSQPYIAAYAALSKGIRPNQWDLPFEEFRQLPVLLPPLEEQRRIADFLDTETTRLDHLTASRTRQRNLIVERTSAEISGIVEELFAKGPIPLRRMITSIEQGWSPVCDDAEAESHEWAVLKTSAVSAGHFEPLQHKRLPGGIDPDRRFAVDDGDLLMTRGSGSPALVGVAVVARPGGRRLLISDLLYRVTPKPAHNPDFIAALLRSQPVRERMSLLFRGQSGQTIKLRSEDVAAIPLPAVDPEEQGAVFAKLQDLESGARRLIDTIDRSQRLIREYRQALITAAVTGQLDVTTAVSVEM